VASGSDCCLVSGDSGVMAWRIAAGSTADRRRQSREPSRRPARSRYSRHRPTTARRGRRHRWRHGLPGCGRRRSWLACCWRSTRRRRTTEQAYASPASPARARQWSTFSGARCAVGTGR
jgi:hypothetical protein